MKNLAIFICVAFLAALVAAAPEGVREEESSADEEQHGREAVADTIEEEGEINTAETHESRRMKRTASSISSEISKIIHGKPSVEYTLVPLVKSGGLKEKVPESLVHELTLPLIGKVSLPKLSLPSSLSSLSSKISSKLSSTVVLPILGTKVSLPVVAAPIAVKKVKLAALKAPLVAPVAVPIAVAAKKKLAAAALISHKSSKFSK